MSSQTPLIPPSNTAQPVALSLQPVNLQSLHLDHERMMDCIHCGLCLSQCPTYAENGLEADSPRGRIYLMRALAEGRVEPTPDVTQHFDSCLGCRACETACPSGVQYGHLLEGTRAYLRETQPPSMKKSLILRALESTFPFPNRLDKALLPIRALRKSGVMAALYKTGFMKLLGDVGAMESMLPALAPTGKHRKFPETFPARGEQQAHVGMITGCVMPVMQGHVNEATARVLSKAGCAVDAPKGQSCCGALHAHSGDMKTAKQLAQQTIELFEKQAQSRGELDAIIINAAGCGAALKEYDGWFKDDPQWAERAKQFTAKVRDVSEFLAEPRFKSRLESLMKPIASQNPHQSTLTPETTRDIARETIPNAIGATTVNRVAANTAQSTLEDKTAPTQSDEQTTIDPGRSISGTNQVQPNRMTYHDACHLAHGQGVRTQPRELVALGARGEGIEVVPLHESDMCCGSAGTYNILQPKMANRLLERKMKHIAATGAKYVVSANPGCTMQLKMGAKKFGVPVEILHPVEVLDRATES